MVPRPIDLPEFEHPPLVEVAIAMGFERLARFRQGHFGLFWADIADSYPYTWDHERILRPSLSLSESGARGGLSLQLVESAPTDRAWFVSADDRRLVQLQDDRLVHNWRRRGADDLYPRFDSIAAEFRTHVDRLELLVGSRDIGQLVATDIEVTYVNWIESSGPETFLADQSPSLLPQSVAVPINSAGNREYFVEEGGVGVGRLAVGYGPAQSFDGKPGYHLSLTYRQPRRQAIEDWNIADDLLFGRRTIVRSFAALTSERRHEEWGRTS